MDPTPAAGKCFGMTSQGELALSLQPFKGRKGPGSSLFQKENEKNKFRLLVGF